MKRKLKTKHKITLIGIIVSVIVAFIQSGWERGDTQSIEGNENTVVNGDNNIVNSSVNNYYDDYKTDLDGKTPQELLKIAETAYLAEDYNYAFDVYNHECLSENNVALINRGFIYTRGLSYFGVDYENAEACYKKVNSLSAYRNLLALYLRCEDSENAKDLLQYLLYVVNDAYTWDYISYCLYDTDWITHSENTGILKNTFSFDILELFDFSPTGETKACSVPEGDTRDTIWVYKGIDWEEGEGYSHPYIIYEKYTRLFLKEIDRIEKMCFTDI